MKKKRRFNVGERVITPYGIGTVVRTSGGVFPGALVQHDTWNLGHNGAPDDEHLGLTGCRSWYFGYNDLTLLGGDLSLLGNKRCPE